MAAKKNDDRFARLESAQRETNRRLGKIEDTLATSSRIFELMHARLEHLESGQERLIARVERMGDAMDRVVDRLDLLVESSTRDRTLWVERFGRIEDRVGRLESSVFPGEER